MKRFTGLSTAILTGFLAVSSMTAQEAEGTKLSELTRISDAIGLPTMIVEKFQESFMSNPEVTASGLSEESLQKMQSILIERFDMNDFLENALLPVVDPHFTTEELGSIADLLETSLGQNFLEAQKNGEEFDLMEKMKSGEVDRAEAMQAMTVFMTIGPKLQELEGGELKTELETSVKSYVESFFLGVVAEMIDNSAE